MSEETWAKLSFQLPTGSQKAGPNTGSNGKGSTKTGLDNIGRPLLNEIAYN